MPYPWKYSAIREMPYETITKNVDNEKTLVIIAKYILVSSKWHVHNFLGKMMEKNPELKDATRCQQCKMGCQQCQMKHKLQHKSQCPQCLPSMPTFFPPLSDVTSHKMSTSRFAYVHLAFCVCKHGMNFYEFLCLNRKPHRPLCIKHM